LLKFVAASRRSRSQQRHCSTEPSAHLGQLEQIVGIEKLDIFSTAAANSSIPCRCQPQVPLLYDNHSIIMPGVRLRHGVSGISRPIIYDNDFDLSTRDWANRFLERPLGKPLD